MMMMMMMNQLRAMDNNQTNIPSLETTHLLNKGECHNYTPYLLLRRHTLSEQLQWQAEDISQSQEKTLEA